MTSKPSALDAFIARKTEIDGMLERLTTLSADQFGIAPDAVDWGHVGTLTHYAELLKRITTPPFGRASTPSNGAALPPICPDGVGPRGSGQ